MEPNQLDLFKNTPVEPYQLELFAYPPPPPGQVELFASDYPGEACLYFVVDSAAELIFYVGETLRSNKRWKGNRLGEIDKTFGVVVLYLQ